MAERFWKRVRRGAPDDCWEWTGPFDWDGYGLMGMPNSYPGPKSFRAHRVSWELEHGEWPGKSMVLHRCDNPPCVNPGHLFLGTAKDNFHDCLAKGRYSPKGRGNAAAKLTEQDVWDIRANYLLCKVSQRELGIRFGVTQTAISSIILGKSWAHV